MENSLNFADEILKSKKSGDFKYKWSEAFPSNLFDKEEASQPELFTGQTDETGKKLLPSKNNPNIRRWQREEEQKIDFAEETIKEADKKKEEKPKDKKVKPEEYMDDIFGKEEEKEEVKTEVQEKPKEEEKGTPKNFADEVMNEKDTTQNTINSLWLKNDIINADPEMLFRDLRDMLYTYPGEGDFISVPTFERRSKARKEYYAIHPEHMDMETFVNAIRAGAYDFKDEIGNIASKTESEIELQKMIKQHIHKIMQFRYSNQTKGKVDNPDYVVKIEKDFGDFFISVDQCKIMEDRERTKDNYRFEDQLDRGSVYYILEFNGERNHGENLYIPSEGIYTGKLILKDGDVDKKVREVKHISKDIKRIEIMIPSEQRREISELIAVTRNAYPQKVVKRPPPSPIIIGEEDDYEDDSPYYMRQGYKPIDLSERIQKKDTSIINNVNGVPINIYNNKEKYSIYERLGKNEELTNKLHEAITNLKSFYNRQGLKWKIIQRNTGEKKLRETIADVIKGENLPEDTTVDRLVNIVLNNFNEH